MPWGKDIGRKQKWKDNTSADKRSICTVRRTMVKWKMTEII